MPKPASKSISFATAKKRALAILLLALAVGSVAYPPPANWLIDRVNGVFGSHVGHIDKGFVLGLDLQGGTRLEYEADVSQVAAAERQSALDGVRDVIERRVNTIGVSEPLVQTARAGDAWRVSVELAGIRDINQAIKLIGETPILEFKEQNTDKPRDLTAEEKKKMEEANAKELKDANDLLQKSLKNPADVESLAKASSSHEATRALGGDLGFIKDKPEYKFIYDQVRNDAAGSVHPKLIDMEQGLGYAIAKVEEVKPGTPEIKANHILIQYLGATGASSSTKLTKEQAKQRIEEIKKEVTPANFVELAKKYSEEPGASESGGDLGWFGPNVMVPSFEKAAFALKKGEISGPVETDFGYHLIFKSDERPANDVHVRAIFVKKTQATDILPPQSEWKATQLTGKQLKRAQLDFDQRNGSAQVSLQFNDEGTKLFAEITKRNMGKPVAIFLDDQPISIPTVQTEITNGNAVITGMFSIEEAKLLAQRLQAGALPVPIKLIAQQSVGPTLGQDSVDKSVRAGLYGFLFVAIFMLVVYRLPGLISLISLMLYVGISFAIFKYVPVTLTLSGIAGFILSLGIALDANVLVFERLKEELKSGKSYGMALEEAFRRAWSSIRDGNATTLISCAVLYWFSSSVIKGFALTLAIGILVSLFTSITITRNILRFIAGTGLPAKLRWFFLDSSSSNDPRV